MYHSLICLASQVFRASCVHHGANCRGTRRHGKDGSRWHGQQEDCDHAGLAAVDDEAMADGEMVPCHVGRPRWMLEKVGSDWVRRLKPCVTAKTGFF